MKFCRFNQTQLGVVVDGAVADVSAVLDDLPSYQWGRPWADPFVAHLDQIKAKAQALVPTAVRFSLDDITIEPPIPLPSKIIGAPVNYHAHFEEALADRALHQGRKVYPIDQIGCFLKASSALVGHKAILQLPTHAERVDQEGEIAVIIGKTAKGVSAENALHYIAGYSLALDMSIRGKQDRSLRKSCDGFAVVGPYFVTADEIPHPDKIQFTVTVNGEVRQQGDTGLLIRSIPELIEMCSAYYTLHPGDIIMTGTPAGVGPISSGDKIDVRSPAFGNLSITIS